MGYGQPTKTGLSPSVQIEPAKISRVVRSVEAAGAIAAAIKARPHACNLGWVPSTGAEGGVQLDLRTGEQTGNREELRGIVEDLLE